MSGVISSSVLKFGFYSVRSLTDLLPGYSLTLNLIPCLMIARALIKVIWGNIFINNSSHTVNYELISAKYYL